MPSTPQAIPVSTPVPRLIMVFTTKYLVICLYMFRIIVNISPRRRESPLKAFFTRLG